jgi:hypothetical protein
MQGKIHLVDNKFQIHFRLIRLFMKSSFIFQINFG